CLSLCRGPRGLPTSTTSTRLSDRARGTASIHRSSLPGPLAGGVHAGVPGPDRSGLVLVVDQDRGLADAGDHGRLPSLCCQLPPPRAPASGGGPVACPVLSSPLCSPARRFLPRRRRSAPSARSRPATWRRRRGAPRR